jgi:glycosyltransferase involved in cell wall biosynthesis
VRIGIIAPPWLPTPPTTYGGTELIVDLLARGLQDAGHDVTLVATGNSTCPVPTRFLDAEPPEIMGDSIIEARHVLFAYEALAGVDVIHDHTLLGPLFAASHRVAPIVTTNHGPFTPLTKPLFRDIGERTSLVAISVSQAHSAGRGIRIAKVIPHGIDVDAIPVGRGDGGYVLFLGRMTPEKGAHLAIDAARRAGVRIVVAAKCREPKEQQYFDRMIAPRLGPGAEFVGEVGGADKWELLGAATALVNPIRWSEPFGLVMAEALACGTPVVACPVGAAPEIVDHGLTGFLCSTTVELDQAVRDAETIDRAICRKVAADRHSMDRMVADHVELYSRLSAGAQLAVADFEADLADAEFSETA